MKRILLTGASGFMGGHVLRHLLTKTDWEVVGIASFAHRGKSARLNRQLEGLDRKRFKLVVHDLTNPITKEIAQEIGKVDYVLNVASESHVDRSIEEPRDFIDNNVRLMLTMLDYIREYPVEKFLHISTDEVYGPADKHNHREGEPHRPSNPYSASKSCQESIAYAYWRTYGLPIVITNTMNIIGETQDTEKFVPMVIRSVVNGDTMTIHASPDGVVGSRFYLHARNQADALVYLLNNHTPTSYPADDIDRFNIVGEREVDNLEMAQLIAESVGKPLNYELVDFHSSRPGHDLRYALDGEKMRKIGWRPPHTLEESVKTTVEWTLNNKEWIK